MKITVNGKTLEPTSPVTTGHALFELLQQQPGLAQGIITGVQVDGLPAGPPDPSGPFPPDGIQGDLYEITIENPFHVLRRSVEDGISLLEMLEGECAETADLYRDGDENAPDHLGAMLDRIALFMDYVSGILTFVENTFDGFDGGKRTDELLQITLTANRAVLTAQENQDNIALADALEFELAPQLGLWREFLAGPDFAIHDEATV
jgi:hypothetical protein